MSYINIGIPIFIVAAIWMLVPKHAEEVPKLHTLQRTITVTDDTWNNIPSADFRIEYRKDNMEFARARIRVAVGQIGWISINHPHVRDGLREDILFDIVKIMSTYESPPETIWEAIVSPTDALYIKWGFQYKSPAHSSVTGSGWSRNLTDLLKERL